MGIRRQILDWVAKKISPSTAGFSGQGGGYVDAHRAELAPQDLDLIDAFEGVAFAAANINASSCATIPLKLFVTTKQGQAKPRVATSEVSKDMMDFMRRSPQIQQKLINSQRVEEVTEHQILTSLRQGNDEMHGYDLMHNTSCYLDIVGRTYWGIKKSPLNSLGVADELWVLPPHQTRGKSDRGPNAPIDYYEWKPTGFLAKPIIFDVADTMKFRLVSLKEPYNECWSPLKAAWEKVRWMAMDSAESNSLMKNRSLPELFISPADKADMFGDDETKRLERMFNTRYLGRKMGGIHISRTPLKVDSPARSSRDDERVTRWALYKNSVLNSFGVPIALFEAKQINRATLEAAMVQHGKYTVLPRLMYMVQVLNHKFVSRFDDRLFLWFENPVPKDEEKMAQIRAKNLECLLTAVNEERAKLDMAPVEWGEKPWRPTEIVPIDTPVLDPNKLAAKAERPEPKKEIDVESNEKNVDDKVVLSRLLILLDHAAKKLDIFQSIKALTKYGCTTNEVEAWLSQSGSIDDYEEKAEGPQEPTLTNWYREGDSGGHRRAMPTGNKLEKLLRNYFRQQREYVVSVIRSAILRSPDYKLKVFGSDQLNFGTWTATLRDSVIALLTIEFQRGANDAAKRLGIDALRVQDPHIKEAIEKLAMEFALSTNMTTTKDISVAMQQLKTRLGDVMTGDENTIAELTKAVQGVFDLAEEVRAKRIAITESSRAVHVAQRMTGEKSGIVKGYKWLASSDACPICITIRDSYPDGIPIGGTFAITSDNPIYGEIKEPPAHPNCQCTMVENIDWDALKG